MKERAKESNKGRTRKSYYPNIETLIEDFGLGRFEPLDLSNFYPDKKYRVNILALGDVGRSMLIGLKLLGSEVIEKIGIYDLDRGNVKRLERELNQIAYPFNEKKLPQVIEIRDEKELFDCELFIFCASKGVPKVSKENEKIDVRMVQLEENKKIASYYGNLAKSFDYQGMIAVVSDPVDPLAYAFLKSSNCQKGKVHGFGLGVMNARALYYSESYEKFSEYKENGLAFGPHGEGLILSNNPEPKKYDDRLSKELTSLVIKENLNIRELGYKPYIAPSLSSAAISIILMLQGRFHYSSIYLGNETKGAFFGIKNKVSKDGKTEFYKNEIDEALYERVRNSYKNLLLLNGFEVK